jgi:hypothetical protein
MDIHRMLDELRAERELVEEAIIVLSRLDAREKRRGRPPLWMSEMYSVTEPKKGGRVPGRKNRSKLKVED